MRPSSFVAYNGLQFLPSTGGISEVSPGARARLVICILHLQAGIDCIPSSCRFWLCSELMFLIIPDECEVYPGYWFMDQTYTRALSRSYTHILKDKITKSYNNSMKQPKWLLTRKVPVTSGRQHFLLAAGTTICWLAGCD